ncbi:DJ-1/PfpI family protein [Herbihabitans rhizosphaerae]|uniref:DJ-1/PfpI family protein n=1 Tax=Herbihabitans rhizosphaerae TaxID=1872711 RepID=A0A4Q7L573_9PSEU|nr:DJ-1/PfpI family protein [Herbihabitans rhizosphaerae]RZS44414.1 DJ-1/PfpI family protein [Herbihabitans rhizosphaerae]
MTTVAIALYDGFDVLDATGPYDVLGSVPGVDVTFVARQAGPVHDGRKQCALVAEASFAELSTVDVVVVPGTIRKAPPEEVLLDWVRTAHRTTTWTTSVCSGALILGAAGLLEGRRATTHWTAIDRLAEYGATPEPDSRYVVDGKIVTSAGVSAGIDMALHLVARMHGTEMAQAVQLGLEYAPRPPFDAGTPATAPAEITQLVRSAIDAAG